MRTLLLAIAVMLSPVASAQAQTPTAKATNMSLAIGSFEVKVAPTGHGADPSISTFSLDKQFHGNLEATSKGEMLSAGDPTKGNAGYVAIEHVSGNLGGRAGAFVLMQMGTMSNGSAPQMTVVIVPGSGTGDLSGIYGTMTITIAEGKHTYSLEYAFAAK